MGNIYLKGLQSFNSQGIQDKKMVTYVGVDDVDFGEIVGNECDMGWCSIVCVL